MSTPEEHLQRKHIPNTSRNRLVFPAAVWKPLVATLLIAWMLWFGIVEMLTRDYSTVEPVVGRAWGDMRAMCAQNPTELRPDAWSATGDPYRKITINGRSAFVSRGPDGVISLPEVPTASDLSTFGYDPTNGVASGGDMIFVCEPPQGRGS